MSAATLLIYASANGDEWHLERAQDGRAFVRHVPNASSGGELSQIELSAFLSRDRGSPQNDSLLRLIGTLVPLTDVPSEVSQVGRSERYG